MSQKCMHHRLKWAYKLVVSNSISMHDWIDLDEYRQMAITTISLPLIFDNSCFSSLRAPGRPPPPPSPYLVLRFFFKFQLLLFALHVCGKMCSCSLILLENETLFCRMFISVSKYSTTKKRRNRRRNRRRGGFCAWESAIWVSALYFVWETNEAYVRD